MPKAILEFDLPEETEYFDDARKGSTYKYQVDEIWLKVFRPAFKHGYNDAELNALLETEDGFKIVEKLADLYREVIKDNEF